MSYEFQKTLSNHTRVDCIIKSSGSLNNLCIDAKFPRESFEKVLKSTSKDEKNKVLKMFKSDIMNHVMDVKHKYIIPGETSEIELIFIPSEQIYVEIFNLIPEMTEQFYDFKGFSCLANDFMDCSKLYRKYFEIKMIQKIPNSFQIINLKILQTKYQD